MAMPKSKKQGFFKKLWNATKNYFIPYGKEGSLSAAFGYLAAKFAGANPQAAAGAIIFSSVTATEGADLVASIVDAVANKNDKKTNLQTTCFALDRLTNYMASDGALDAAISEASAATTSSTSETTCSFPATPPHKFLVAFGAQLVKQTLLVFFDDTKNRLMNLKNWGLNVVGTAAVALIIASENDPKNEVLHTTATAFLATVCALYGLDCKIRILHDFTQKLCKPHKDGYEKIADKSDPSSVQINI